MSAGSVEAPATTGAPPQGHVVGPTLGRRLVRARPFLLALLLVVVVTLATTTSRPTGSTVPLALDNIHGNGARALAEVLGSYGVDARAARTFNTAVEKADADPDNTTLVVLGISSLRQEQIVLLRLLDVDVVVLGTTFAQIDDLTDVEATGASAPKSSTLTPGCEDPDAQAAASLSGSRGSLVLPEHGADSYTGCFPVGEGFAYVVGTRQNGHSLRLIADASIARNDSLAEAGNAALLVRSLGHKDKVVWFDATNPEPTVWETESVPTWLPVLMLNLGVSALVLALVRGRRMGRLVREDLPVQVPATEATVGLGRLYQRARDREHASRALRQGTARRLGRRLGLADSADGQVLLDELVRQAGPSADPRTRQRAKTLLYGPPPGNDQELTALAERLDHLESEVQNR